MTRRFAMAHGVKGGDAGEHRVAGAGNSIERPGGDNTDPVRVGEAGKERLEVTGPARKLSRADTVEVVGQESLGCVRGYRLPFPDSFKARRAFTNFVRSATGSFLSSGWRSVAIVVW